MNFIAITIQDGEIITCVALMIALIVILVVIKVDEKQNKEK